jgi:hypothetical protein
MAKNFIAVDREQVFLMPPSLREWLPEGHLAWCVLDAVAEMDLSAFYVRYREDGPGRPAYEPAIKWSPWFFMHTRRGSGPPGGSNGSAGRMSLSG